MISPWYRLPLPWITNTTLGYCCRFISDRSIEVHERNCSTRYRQWRWGPVGPVVTTIYRQPCSCENPFPLRPWLGDDAYKEVVYLP